MDLISCFLIAQLIISASTVSVTLSSIAASIQNIDDAISFIQIITFKIGFTIFNDQDSWLSLILNLLYMALLKKRIMQCFGSNLKT